MSQLSLLHDLNDDFSEENFLFLKENLAAKNFLENFFRQKNFSKANLQSLIIKGESHSGKSHLLHIFAGKFFVQFLDKKNLPNSFDQNQFSILEDFDEIGNEEEVLHLINSASENKAFLILTTKNNHKFRLKDLVSRLKNIPCAEIKNPSLESVKQLLANGFSRRQIKLSGQMIDFITNNIERSYEAIFLAVKKVEKLCAERGRSLNIKEIEKLINL